MNDYSLYITDSLNSTLASLRGIYPETALTISFIVVILSELFLSKKFKQLPFCLTLFALAVAFILVVSQFNIGSSPKLFSGMIELTHASVYFKLLFLISAILFVVFIRLNKEFQRHVKGTGDIYSVLIAIVLGMNCMAMAGNLLMIYLSVEMVSIGSYILVGYISGGNKQAEASIKYAIFGAASSAIMLYGISLLYAYSGSLNLSADLLEGLSHVSALSTSFALVLVFAGIGFKLSFFPMHFWTPDVYEGAPTPVAAFLSTGSKIAGFALLWRILQVFSSSESEFRDFNFGGFISIISIVTMLFGNFAAIWQNNMKRMLAYSSIGHTGFLMMALTGSANAGFNGMLFYLMVYLFMNFAAFLLVDKIEDTTGATKISDFKGLGKQLPITFISLIIVLVSLTGLPPTGGFIAKFFVFSSALEAYNSSGSSLALWMMITGAVTTVVSLFYYFKVPLFAYLKKQDEPATYSESFDIKLWMSVTLALLLILAGIFPQIISGLIN